jgi:hypothetical protein
LEANDMSNRLLAYAVQEDCENTGGIVFAKSNAAARRAGSQTFGDGDFNWGRAIRAPWADEYSPGPVPFKAMFEQGWWQECSFCGRKIQQGECDDDGPVAFDIVEEGGHVYCTPKCHAGEIERQAREAVLKDETVGKMTGTLLERMPGACVCGSPHVYVRRKTGTVEEARVYFIFPGQRFGTAEFMIGKAGEDPYVMVSHGDRAAFYRWQSLGYPPHLMDSVLD